MTKDEDIRLHALNSAINRLGNTTIAAMPTETILDMARAFEIYIKGAETDTAPAPVKTQTGPVKKRGQS